MFINVNMIVLKTTHAVKRHSYHEHREDSKQPLILHMFIKLDEKQQIIKFVPKIKIPPC